MSPTESSRELLIEILTEELPALPFLKEFPHIHTKFEQALHAHNLHAHTQIHFTPRRIAIIARSFPTHTDSKTIELFGPPIDIAYMNGDPSKGFSKAGESFLQKAGLDSTLATQKLQKATKNGKEVLFVRNTMEGVASSQVLPLVVIDFLHALEFGKAMRWGTNVESFIRPIRNILVLLGGKPISIKEYGQEGRAATLVHRSFGTEWRDVRSIDEYLAVLEQGGVVLDERARKQKIIEQIRHIEKIEGITVELDPRLLEEVVAITEYPSAHLGRFDERFLQLPQEVIITSMKEHQRYFSAHKQGSLYNGFIVVTNAICKDFSTIISGNERVLKARLSDAEFFYHNDIARGLDSSGLAEIAFVDGAGSLAQKVAREKSIGTYLASRFSLEAAPIVEALTIAKSDLLSEMVGEFPELQGIMGSYYARAQGFSEEVAQALKEQYLPNGEDSPLPSCKVSAIVAMCGKLDNLLMLFSLNKIPTGSKDPFALRRACFGVLKIVLEHDLRLDLDQDLYALMEAGNYESTARTKELAKQDRAHKGKIERADTTNNHKGDAIATLTRLQEFMLERLESILGYNSSIFRAASRGKSLEISTIARNAKALESLLARDDREQILAVFKRVANITKDAQKELFTNDLKSDDHTTSKVAHKDTSADVSTQAAHIALDSSALIGLIDTNKLALAEEKALYKEIAYIVRTPCTSPESRLNALFGLRKSLEVFFESVMVNDENIDLRRNRKLLMYAIYAEFMMIGDLKELAI